MLLGLFAWSRRDEPAAKPLAATFLLGAIWAFTYGMDLDSKDVAVKTAWMLIRLSFNQFIPLATLWVAMEHLERSYQFRKWLPVLLAAPAVTILLAWTGDHHQLYRYDYATRQIGELALLTWKTGPAYWLSYFFSVAVYAAALYQMLRSLSEANATKRGQTAILIIGLFTPLVTDLTYNFGLSPIAGLNFTPYAMIISEGLLAFAILNYGWLRIAPVARSLLVDTLPGGMIAIDVKCRIVDVNPYAEKILNMPASEILGKDARLILAGLDAEIFSALLSAQAKTELRLVRADGTADYFDMDVRPFHNNAGKFLGKLIYLNDITERKRNEQRLLQLNQAVAQSPASVVISDLDGNIVYVNESFKALSGYAEQELIGKNPRIIQSGQTPSETYREMWNTIKAGKPWRGEFLNKRKNGDLYWELEVIAPVFDARGKIINYIAVKEDITESKRLEHALQVANKQIADRLEEIVGLQATLKEQAIRDPLTQLYNRHFLNETIEHEFHQAERSSQPVSVIMLDIDHFKAVNDTYGHAVGDAYLVTLANLLQQNTRKSDIACRYGGEEFLLVLPNTDYEAAAQHAEKLRLVFANSPLTFKDHKVQATLSLGVAAYPAHGAHYSKIIDKADQALYESKRAGRNRVTVWSEQIRGSEE